MAIINHSYITLLLLLPLSDLTRKGQPNKVFWEEPQERAYAALKQAVISKRIMMLPDVNKEFVLRTDASFIGLGTTLLHNRDGHILPVAYASRKLLNREQRYSVMERECLGIYLGYKAICFVSLWQTVHALGRSQTLRIPKSFKF